MIYKDYYNDLGIEKSATPAEIKKAFRKLAVKYHPDKNSGQASAEERFKIISEANEVLSDPIKRKKYDQFGADWKHYEDAGAKPGGFDWSKYSSGEAPHANAGGGDEFESVLDGEIDSDLFQMLFGHPGRAQRRRRGAPMRGGNREITTSLTLEEVYHGATRRIQMGGQTIQVTVGAGIGDGQTLRIAGKGENGYQGGAPGDLFLTVKISPHKDYERMGNDLHETIDVDLYTMLLGGKTDIKALKGAVTLDIPKATPNGKELRLRGLGMPLYKKKDEFGDLFVKVNVALPEALGASDLELVKTLASHRH